MQKQKKNTDPFADAEWLAWFDGSAKPHPGTCHLACILKGKNGEQFHQTLHIGYGDSSDAEYQALIAALRLIQQHVASSATERVLLRGDSQVVINDILGPEKDASPKLAEYRKQAHALLSELTTVSLKWVPRHKNTEADALMRNNIDIKN